MKEKKTGDIMSRVTPSVKADFEVIAAELGFDKPGQLSALLIKSFVEQKKEHGAQLIWPPQFNHHISAATYLDRIGKADEERLQLVAEKADEYGKPDKKQNAHTNAG